MLKDRMFTWALFLIGWLALLNANTVFRFHREAASGGFISLPVCMAPSVQSLVNTH